VNPEGPDTGAGTTDQVAARAGLAGTATAAPTNAAASAEKHARRDIDILMSPPELNNTNEDYRKQVRPLRQCGNGFPLETGGGI
jgi:hypothetical protein